MRVGVVLVLATTAFAVSDSSAQRRPAPQPAVVIPDTMSVVVVGPVAAKLDPARLTVKIDEKRSIWDSNLVASLLSALVGAAVAIIAVLLGQGLKDRSDASRTRARLITRVGDTLETAVGTLDAVVRIKSDGKRKFDPQSMQRIVIAWQRYDRLSDDLDLLEKAENVRGIDGILWAALDIASAALEDERLFEDELAHYPHYVDGVTYMEAQEVRHHHKNQRLKRLKMMEEVLAGARPVLDAFNTRWNRASSLLPPAELAADLAPTDVKAVE